MLILISCTPISESQVISTFTYTATNELPTTATLNSDVMKITLPASTSTMKPSIDTLYLPKVTTTTPFITFIQKEYNPSEWKILYDKDTALQIGLNSKDQIWILTGEQVGYFDGGNWVLYSNKDYGFPNEPHDMAIAPDGTVWIAGRHAISHYQNGLWSVYQIKNFSETGYARIAINSSNLVWLSMWLCDCGNSLRIFDGINWDERSLPSIGQLEVYQLLFTSDGVLWASFYRAIGQYNGKTWNIYLKTDLWPERSNYGIRIASDSQGNVYGIDYSQEWIVKINRDGNISKVPFDFVHYNFIPELMRIFIDKQGRIWTNACFIKQNGFRSDNCFVYYQDNQWISFKDLPFWNWFDMKELSDGTLLVATNKGLFQYKPEN